MFGLDHDTIRNIKQVFAKIPDIDKVILYGSRAKGNYRNGSDIDITLLGESLTLNNSVYPLMDELEELYLPYMFDISIFSDIDNENLIEHINRVGKVFYRKERGLPDGDALSLPKGWEMRKLGEVYDVRDGTHDSPKYINKGFALITSKNLKNDTLNYDKVKYISEEDYININKRSKVDIGDILFAMIGTIGNPIVIKDKPCFAIENVALFKVPENQDSYFLKYYLDSKDVIQRMRKDAKGTTQRFVGLSYLRNFKILLPKLPEQKRIVAILDQAFTAIAKAKTNAEQNLKNAREVFQSALQTEFANGKLKIESGEWEEKTLGEVCDVKGGKRLPKGKKLQEEKTNFPYIRIADFDHAGSVNLTAIKYLTVDVQKEISRYTISKNDVFLSIAGTIGISGIVPDQLDGANLTENACKLVFDRSILNRRFLYFYANSLEFKKQVGLFTKTTAQPKLALTRIKSIIINFPKSLGKQKNIVKKLDAISTETKKLEIIYQQKINDLDELKKSILQKAFSGEL